MNFYARLGRDGSFDNSADFNNARLHRRLHAAFLHDQKTARFGRDGPRDARINPHDLRKFDLAVDVGSFPQKAAQVGRDLDSAAADVSAIRWFVAAELHRDSPSENRILY